MTRARQLFVTALAAVALIVTAAPAAPGPDLSEYAWEPMFGSETSPIANDSIFALKVVGDDLYVGGSFTDFAGIAAADRIARWSGADQEWQALEAPGAIQRIDHFRNGEGDRGLGVECVCGWRLLVNRLLPQRPKQSCTLRFGSREVVRL